MAKEKSGSGDVVVVAVKALTLVNKSDVGFGLLGLSQVNFMFKFAQEN